MDAPVAVQAARILGAHTFVPFHYAVQGLPGLLRCPSFLHDLPDPDAGNRDITVRVLPTGQRTIVLTALPSALQLALFLAGVALSVEVRTRVAPPEAATSPAPAAG